MDETESAGPESRSLTAAGRCEAINKSVISAIGKRKGNDSGRQEEYME